MYFRHIRETWLGDNSICFNGCRFQLKMNTHMHLLRRSNAFSFSTQCQYPCKSKNILTYQNYIIINWLIVEYHMQLHICYETYSLKKNEFIYTERDICNLWDVIIFNMKGEYVQWMVYRIKPVYQQSFKVRTSKQTRDINKLIMCSIMCSSDLYSNFMNAAIYCILYFCEELLLVLRQIRICYQYEICFDKILSAEILQKTIQI